MIIDNECPVCLGVGEIHGLGDCPDDAGEDECPRCAGTGLVAIDLNDDYDGPAEVDGFLAIDHGIHDDEKGDWDF